MKDYKNLNFHSKIENELVHNNVLFLKIPISSQEEILNSLLKNNNKTTYINSNMKFLPGMNLRTYINFILKWVNCSNYEEVKFELKKYLNNHSIFPSFYINLVANTHRIIITNIPNNIINDPIFFEILKLGYSLMNKKYVLVVDDLYNDNIRNFKSLDIAKWKFNINSNRINTLKGTSLTSENITFIPVKDVIFFESINSIIYAQLKEDRIKINKTLKNLENTLPSSFFRTHRCYIVNLNYPVELTKTSQSSYDVILENFKIPLSKYRLKEFKYFIKMKNKG